MPHLIVLNNLMPNKLFFNHILNCLWRKITLEIVSLLIFFWSFE